MLCTTTIILQTKINRNTTFKVDNLTHSVCKQHSEVLGSAGQRRLDCINVAQFILREPSGADGHYQRDGKFLLLTEVVLLYLCKTTCTGIVG